jgi:hypothetical protein
MYRICPYWGWDATLHFATSELNLSVSVASNALPIAVPHLKLELFLFAQLRADDLTRIARRLNERTDLFIG